MKPDPLLDIVRPVRRPTAAQLYSAVSVGGFTRVRRVHVWRYLGPAMLIGFAAGMYFHSLIALGQMEGWW